MNYKIRCSDYIIIKVRYYADNKLLNKHHKLQKQQNKSLPLPEQHHQRSKLYNEFFWKFIEKLTNKNMKQWHNKYMLETRECLHDEIEENFGIITSKEEGRDTFLIPKNNSEIINWFKENITIPYKEVRKINLGYIGFERNIKYRREDSIKYTKDFKIKYDL